MKVLHLCLALVVFSALVALSNPNLKSSPSATAKRTNSVSTVSVDIFSSQSTAPTEMQGNGKRSDQTPGPLNPPPKKRCKTELVDQLSFPPPEPSDSTPNRWKFEETENTVLMIPNVGIDDRSMERNGIETLDQGSDLCPATEIPSLPYTDVSTTALRADNFTTSCTSNSTYPDVIYSYTAVQSVSHIFEVTGSFNGGMSIRTGGTCPGEQEIACARQSSSVSITRELIQGVTYYIVVDIAVNSFSTYTFHVDALAPCVADLAFTAPGTISGNTCFAGDNCLRNDSEDQIVQVTIPADGSWTFSMCDNQLWDATLYLTMTCCGDSVIRYSSYGCEYNSPWWISRPVVGPVYLTAGIYYLEIESYRSNGCGAWTITAEQLPPCVTHPVNDVCENAGPAVTLPAIFTGDNTCAQHHCDLLINGQGETWHAFVLDSPASVNLRYDNTRYYRSRYRVLVSGCPCQSLIQSSSDYYPDLFFFNLPAGTYYYPVLRDSANYDEGPYTISAQVIQSCQISSQPGDIVECAEIPSQVALGTDCDKGCSGTTTAFQQIELGQSVYGRGFSYWHGNYMTTESDWYEFTVSDTSVVSISISAEMPIEVGIYERDCNIYWTSYAYGSSILPCTPFTISTECLRPHTYAINVRPENVMMSTDSMHYRFTVSAEACALTCVVDQQPGDVSENEQICADGYIDSFNAGCNGSPEIFQAININETIYGSTGLYHRGTAVYCDMDWFQFTTTEPSIITLSAIAEFEVYLIISDYCPGCDGGLAENYGPSCQTVTTSTRCEEAGVYYASVFPANSQYLPCGAKYRAWVTSTPCAPCTNLQEPSDFVENEPSCSTYVDYYDHFNGGLNSIPPVFGTELYCGQAMWGKSGSWWGNNSNKDTDWMPITVGNDNTLTVNVVAQFPVMTAILGPTAQGNLDSVRLYSTIGTGNACDTVQATSFSPLEAGTYWVYVSPTQYYGVICGAEYRVWVNCGPCNPVAVTDVTIRRDGNNIVLRWSTDPDFTGFYAVYSSVRDVEESREEWLPLTTDIRPMPNGIATYTIVGAITSSDSQIYKIYARCP